MTGRPWRCHNISHLQVVSQSIRPLDPPITESHLHTQICIWNNSTTTVVTLVLHVTVESTQKQASGVCLLSHTLIHDKWPALHLHYNAKHVAMFKWASENCFETDFNWKKEKQVHQLWKEASSSHSLTFRAEITEDFVFALIVLTFWPWAVFVRKWGWDFRPHDPFNVRWERERSGMNRAELLNRI